MGKYCTSCGNELNDGDKFCSKCASEVEDLSANQVKSNNDNKKKYVPNRVKKPNFNNDVEEIKENVKVEEKIYVGKYCTSCGKELNNGDKFCKYCGCPIVEPGAVSSNSVPQVKTPETPEERKKGDRVALIAGLLFFGSSFICYLLIRVFNVYNKLFDNIMYLFPCAGIILVLYGIVKYPKNTLLKVLGAVMAIFALISLVAVIILLISCASCIKSFSIFG